MSTVSNVCFISLNFLGHLRKDERDALLQTGVDRSLAKGQHAFEAGDLETTIHILRRGRIKIVQSSPMGREVLLWFCLPGEIFGVSESLQDKPRSVSAITVERSEVVSIEKREFSAWLNDHPAHSLNLLGIMATRLRELSQRFLNLATGNVELQVAKLLIDLSACYGTRVDHSILVNIPLTHQDIGDMIGVSRQYVSATMSNLKRNGILSTKRRFICIEKYNKLAALARFNMAGINFGIASVLSLFMSPLSENALNVCVESLC